MSDRRQVLGGIVIVAAMLLAVVAIATSGGEPGPQRKPGETVAGQRYARGLLAGVVQRGDTLGRPGAPVQVVEYADLQCPICKGFADRALPGLVRRFVAPGVATWQLRLVDILDRGRGGDSARLAQAAFAAQRSGRFWPFVSLALVNQGYERSGYADDAFVRRIAGGVPGLAPRAVVAAIGTPDATRALSGARAAFAAAGAKGTPTILVGPRGGRLEQVRADAGDVADAITRACQAARSSTPCGEP